MPPKRRSSSATKAGGKKVKQEPETPKPKDAFTSAKEALLAAGTQVKSKRKVDEYCNLSAAEVYKDYDCMLNQTNIGNNKNKFYVIQVLKVNSDYFTWNRWGRVGESGQTKPTKFDTPEKAVKDFEKKFEDKTKNNWSDRLDFVSHQGKYTLIEVDGEQDAEVKVDTVDGKHASKNFQACTLDNPTKNLIELIFSNDMFKEAMECMNLDIKKMPLGKLSKIQIAKGFEVLEEIEAAINQKSRNNCLKELSSKFFTTIPHNFGRNRPPIIDNKEIVGKKKKMLMVLADIELAQTLKSENEKAQVEMIETVTVPHPLDQDYSSLKCSLTLMDKETETFKIIEKYLEVTAGGYCNPKIVNVWEVDRKTEGERFGKNDSLENRRLLWHGTNIAVVAAILKSGLRIMPKSGGRVGSGIYFASENSKSACYVRPSKNTGVMFLSEVALGKEHTITRDDCSLKKAPAGFDSVVARGLVEPDPSKDIFITLEGKKIAVPQGKPVAQPQFSDSHFGNSEYLIYNESQCRLRYLLELKMN
ncbi:protein mono-ADP-ribosyltransferase PARP3 [Etheostoma cragini]|uniref:protein mono-ADP-ribosyltransferase PARP3 n=1 Tax=Etheostoma cragini TaxID=417921 RepID=UPI00155DFA27|nr:protein mono-ADP-ribosyltransferase PARP3 [Etheostoma cragini]